MSRDEWRQIFGQRFDLENGLGVRVPGNWLGNDATARKARQRGLEALEQAGLVSLHRAWGEKRTHVLLTSIGREKAERLKA